VDELKRIEQALSVAVARGESRDGPPRLAEAMRYAVFPGGARVRPRLCLAVARACGEDHPGLTDVVAASIELLHCASLVHDDMPCFDQAETRRGKPSVHRAFDERVALLTGDALIVLAFQTLAWEAACAPERLGPLCMIVGRAVGAPHGIVAGQAWECEPQASLSIYQRAKTGALFAGATEAGAAAAGADPGPWRTLGERMGEAYQVADDICDVSADPEVIGKPIGQDAALDRPNAVNKMGMSGATERLEELVAEATASIPDCPGREPLTGLITAEARRFLQRKNARAAA